MLTRTADHRLKSPHVSNKISVIFLFFLCIGLFVALAWPAPAMSAPARPQAVPLEMVKDPADFDNCARVALRQSPFFTKSALEIEVRRLDERDSKSDLFPDLKCAARYYLVQPNDPNVTDPLNYSVAVTTGEYNPIMAYLTLKVTRVITQIATLAHMKAMAAGLERLGKAFLEHAGECHLARWGCRHE